MRNIKFKAWVASKKHMQLPGTLNMWFAVTIESGVNPCDARFETTFLQYTGLKDKNGVEIYEGDIYLPKDGVKRIVEFRDGCFTEKNSFPTFPIDTNGEVIGNIYENPELLKKHE